MNANRLWVLVLVLCLPLTTVTPANAPANIPPLCFREYASTILSSFIALTEQHLRTVEHELAVLAETKEVKSANWVTMRGIIETYQESGVPGIIWFALPDGNYYTTEKGLVGTKLNERKYFPGLMSGHRMIGDLVISKSTGKKSVIITVPVMRDHKIVGGLGASVFLDTLTQEIDTALSLPQDLVFYALAPDGTTTLNRNTQLNFEDPRKQDNESLRNAAEKMLSTREGEVIYEFAETQRFVIYRTSMLTGWKFAIGIKLGSSTPRESR